MDLKQIALMKAEGKKYYHTTVNLNLDDVILFIEMKRKGILPISMDLSRFVRAAFHKQLVELYGEAMRELRKTSEVLK